MASDSSLNNKAFLLTEDNQTIPCLFNPGELALNQSNGWAADVMPGKGVPTLRYTGATWAGSASTCSSTPPTPDRRSPTTPRRSSV